MLELVVTSYFYSVALLDQQPTLASPATRQLSINCDMVLFLALCVALPFGITSSDPLSLTSST